METIKKPHHSFGKGKQNPNYGRKYSIEERKAMSDKMKGLRPSPATEFKKGQTAPNKGKKIFKLSGTNHYKWKGGKKISNGYICILKPNHPFSDNQGYIPEHRIVMEKNIKRFLTKKEVVHHRGIKYPIGSIKNIQDNRIENLKLFSSIIEHLAYHRLIKNKLSHN